MKPPRIDMASVRRILIIKLSALGDIVHALPVSAAVKDAFPEVELDWVVEETFAPLLTGNPCLHAIYPLPKNRKRQVWSPTRQRNHLRQLRLLRGRHYDMTLDLQGLLKSAITAASTGAATRIAYHWLREGADRFEFAIPPPPKDTHVVEHYLNVARYIGANPAAVRFPFHIPDEDEIAVSAMLQAAGIDPAAPFVAINPASASAEKQWGAERFAALSDAARETLGIPSVLVTADVAVAGHVRAAARLPFADLSGRTTFKQLAAVLRRCSAHVCGDTGSGHLAAALGRPVLSIYGPTDPERTCPYGQRRNVISDFSVCGEHCDRRHCRFTRPRCLDAISVERVLLRLDEVLADRADE